MHRRLADSYNRPKTANPAGGRARSCLQFSVSSLQRFEGEDPNWRDNERKKQVAFKQQLDRQMMEVQELRRKKWVDRETWDNAARCQSSIVRSRDNDEKVLTQKLNAKIHEENTQMANSRKYRDFCAKQMERKENEKEIFYHLTSDFLNEAPDQAKSAQGPLRILPDRWKGMDRNQVKLILQEQSWQVQQKLGEKQREMRSKDDWNSYVVSDVRRWQLENQSHQRKVNDTLRHLVLENKILAQQQKARIERQNQEAKNNVPTEDFFRQFGTSNR